MDQYPEFLQDLKPPTHQLVQEMKQHGGVVLMEFVRLGEWRQLVEAVNSLDHGGPYEVVTWKPMPNDWPKIDNPHCRHVVHDAWLPQHIENLQQAQAEHKHYRHGDSDEVTNHFYVPYGTVCHERERMMRAMEALNILDGSLYSRPATPIKDNILPLYAEQPPIHAINHKTMEKHGASITQSQRFDHGKNWRALRPYILSCQTAVVMDNYCFNDDYSGYLSEKMLFPIAAGVPWIYAGNRHQRQRLRERGFRPHMPMAETPEELIQQMLWLKAVFSNVQMTKNWQDSQGETVIHNQRILADLDKTLLSESTLYN